MIDEEQPLILVVDDDIDLRDMIEYVVSSNGYRVASAANGVEALAAIARGMPAVILLDMRMPVMDGPQFIREFRSSCQQRVPIVVMTAAESARQRFMDVDADEFLGKPFDIRAMLETIARCIARPTCG
jgi:CheY-like chemotaxis protein